MLELLFIRHGQTDWNAERRIMGEDPIGLNAVGRQQIRTLSRHLNSISFDALYCSPLQRTLESSAIINQDRKLQIIQDLRLREIEYGEWIGKTFPEIHSLPGYRDYYQTPENPVCAGGESLHAVRDRAISFLEDLKKERPRGRVALVSHADWIKCVILHFLKLPLTQIPQLRIDNGSVSYLTFDKKQVRVIAVNHNPNFDTLFVRRDPL